MLENIYLIGNSENYQEYLNNVDNINFLPLNNLPVVYFPFDFNNKGNTTSINIFSTIVDEKSSIIEKIDPNTQYKCGPDKNIKCSNIKDLYNSISTMEETWQPYNNNNVKTISNIIMIFWLLLTLLILKLLHYYFKEKYSIIMILLISVILIIGIIYAIFLTSGKI
tara:strand:+ start:2848 stop:3345 length:498 start_codon:yes stop_codon:yes gene_type:complete